MQGCFSFIKVHIADFRVDLSYLDRDPLTVAAVELGGVRTLLVVPMLKDDELVGAISIYRLEVRSRTAATTSWSVVKTRASPIVAVMPCRSMSDRR
jgi:hypothetical protein